ncbi:11384_t:CDS:2, partial [Racocetra persica]
MGVYCSWGVAQGIFAVLSSVVFTYGGVNASKRLHNNAIKRILRAPTRFFDTTPLGRIINRGVCVVYYPFDSFDRDLLFNGSLLSGALIRYEDLHYMHIFETLTGLPIIRACREQERFL